MRDEANFTEAMEDFGGEVEARVVRRDGTGVGSWARVVRVVRRRRSLRRDFGR